MKIKVLMVCLGNICRSPLAEGILKSKVDSDSVFVDSAGTAGYHVGNPPDKRSIAVARKYGINISEQKCRKFSSLDFLEFDHIYVMDRSNFSDVASLAKNKEEAAKVKLLLSETELGIKEVPDPYYGGDDGFENVYQMIDRACEAIANKLN
ncbi:MAG: low molecular weight protein-tyrosine-phosphatase [Bacteroidota bacterium]|uniref:protein-tyrosine-phosphatase n=1 Tax=Flagellimonas okinawensis TaxID=3031324 RepID=A0ABT5XJK0_9FLAO|nr:low molecular weight protein-tyrosine-phosphatase [[Muricauda] okinawensis]MDF0705995.1 low molecular weight phosphotyrosine protein phosphatase [[Muricauda] okinawensis]MEC8831838.1 low molecular weight protein-tyrosine-phosphatase [Bacteroidota bacterium]